MGAIRIESDFVYSFKSVHYRVFAARPSILAAPYLCSRYRVGKFIVIRVIAPSYKSARRWLTIMTIGIRVALHGTMAECNTKTACG